MSLGIGFWKQKQVSITMNVTTALLAFIFLTVIVVVMKCINPERREELERARESEAEAAHLSHQLLIERAKLEYMNNEVDYKKARSGTFGRLFVDKSELQKQARIVNQLQARIDRTNENYRHYRVTR